MRRGSFCAIALAAGLMGGTACMAQTSTSTSTSTPAPASASTPAAAAQALRVDGRNIYTVFRSKRDIARALAAEALRQKQFEDAMLLISTDQLWKPYDPASGVSPQAEYEAGMLKQVGGKTVDEIIALAAQLTAADPQLEGRKQAQWRHAHLELLGTQLRLGAMLIDRYVQTHDGQWPDFTAGNSPLPGTGENVLTGKSQVIIITDESALGNPFNNPEAGWVFLSDGKWHNPLPPRSLFNFYALDEQGRALSHTQVEGQLTRLAHDFSPRDRALRARQQAFMAAMDSAQRLLMIYATLHSRHRPDFERYPNWEQFTSATNLAGEVDPQGEVPPPAATPPINPDRHASGVIVYAGNPAEFKPVEDKTIGWVYLTGVAPGSAQSRAPLVGLDEMGRLPQ